MNPHLPVDYGHDPSIPIGHYVERDGEMYIEFMPAANITVDDVNRVNGQIMPTYQITEEKDGMVLECKIIGFSVVPKPKEAI